MKTKKEIIHELEDLKKYTISGISESAKYLLQTQIQVYHLKFIIDKIIKTHPEIISTEDSDKAEADAIKFWNDEIQKLNEEAH